MRAILVISDSIDLQHLAEMADKAIKSTLVAITTFGEIIPRNGSQEQDHMISTLKAKVEALSKKLDKVLRSRSQPGTAEHFQNTFTMSIEY